MAARLPQAVLRGAPTIALLAVALWIIHVLWTNYMYAPWTRDGRLRAEVVNIAPDVGGLVAVVQVHDNQKVHKGDPLFAIDQARFQQTHDAAMARMARIEASIASAKAIADQREAEWRLKTIQSDRRMKMQDAISTEDPSDASSSANIAHAAYLAAVASVRSAEADLLDAVVAEREAELNLTRSIVRAPMDGTIANLNLYAGDYVIAGQARLALISNNLWVYGYFEETKLARVSVGDRVLIRLMSDGSELRGHVDSMAHAITDRDNPYGKGELVADVNPVFTWVRLAQRVPVRIALDEIPKGAKVASGMTCTVTVAPSDRTDR